MDSTSLEKKLWSVDISHVDMTIEKHIASFLGIELHFICDNSATVKLAGSVDLLFIDSLHVYGHLKRELEFYHRNVKQYIIIHDTTIDGWQSEFARNSEETIDWDEIQREYGYLRYPQEDLLLGLWPAVEEFLELHSEWELEKHFANNNGLTILRRILHTVGIHGASGCIHQTSNSGSDVGIKTLYLNLLERVLVGSIFDEIGRCGEETYKLHMTKPFDMQLRASGNDWPPVGFTMIGKARLANIRHCIESVIQQGVPGDFAELGVWRGGACIWARQLFDIAGELDRQVHVFDIFGQLEEYGVASQFISVSKERVIQNFRNFDANFSSTRFHKGLFQNTLRDFTLQYNDTALAVLRIDGNYYDSYQDALYFLYPRVSVGGYIIFDDIYSHTVVMEAWKDFKEDFGLPEEMSRIDGHSGFFMKTIDKTVDFSKMRKPRDTNRLK